MNNGENNIFGQSDSDDPLQVFVIQVQIMQRLAVSEGASQRLKENWDAIDKWLGLDGSEIGPTDLARIAKAMKAYITVGIAPSNKLQPVFDEFSREYKSEGYDFKSDTPPVSVINAFDRILATDEEIKMKRVDDENERSSTSKIEMEQVSTQNKEFDETTEIGVKNGMKIGKVIKIIIAGTVTWVAVVRSYYIIKYEKFSWSSRYFDEGIDLLSFLPPVVVILGFLLFRWAFGETFVAWLIKNKPTAGSTLFIVLISIAAINASTASEMAEEAYYMAEEANSSSSEAASEARSANSSASKAASEAIEANLSCSNR